MLLRLASPLALFAIAACSSAGARAIAADAGAGQKLACPTGMVSIASGTFTMGSKVRPDQLQPHAVTMPPYCMDATEVTVAAYKACASCSVPGFKGDGKGGPAFCNWGVAGRDDHPINCVDWDQATAYCASVGKRLPTEEEWEYAARGVEGREYPWGNALPGRQLCTSDHHWGTCPVGSFSPAGDTRDGLKDMAGDVFEWTASAYSRNYQSPRDDPQRVYRGGGWSHVDPTHFRGADRNRLAPSGHHFDELGFRCAR